MSVMFLESIGKGHNQFKDSVVELMFNPVQIWMNMDQIIDDADHLSHCMEKIDKEKQRYKEKFQ